MTEEKDFKLGKECELRIYLEKKSKIKIILVDGKAEIFGSELVLKETYSFSKPVEYIVPIFTWHGCTVKVKGIIDNHYIAHETPMPMYLNTHACLEKLRLVAEERKSSGPIAMIVGSKAVGKSSLCRILLNYAVREDRTPIFADLDVSQGSLSISGTIGASVIANVIPVEVGMGVHLPHESSLVFCCGKSTPSASSHFNSQVSKLSDIIREKLSFDQKASTSGVIINTGACCSVREDSYKILIHAVAAFEVDVLIVVEDEKLYNYLNKDLPAPFIKIHYLPKSDGIRKSEKDCGKTLKENEIMEYFFGAFQNIESHSFQIPFSELQIYEIVKSSGNEETSSKQTDLSSGTVVPVDITKELKKRILAVSLTTEANDLITSPVIGFISLCKNILLVKAAPENQAILEIENYITDGYNYILQKRKEIILASHNIIEIWFKGNFSVRKDPCIENIPIITSSKAIFSTSGVYDNEGDEPNSTISQTKGRATCIKDFSECMNTFWIILISVLIVELFSVSIGFFIRWKWFNN